jgi:hypothetical protein
MAALQLQMVFQTLRTASVTKAPTMQVSRALPDGQVQPFNVGSVELERVLRIAPHLIPTPYGPKPGFPLHLHHAIISPFLDDLSVQASCSKESPDHLPIELEPVGRDQRDVVSVDPGTDVSKQGESVPIAPLSNNGRRPKARAYFDGSEDPNGRLIFAADQRADLVRLQFTDSNFGDLFMVEAATTGSSFLQPAIHGIPRDLLESSDGRLIDSLDAESSDLIEHSPAMLEAVISGAAVSAESPATTLASESSAFSPAGLVESKTNNYGQRGIGSCPALLFWTEETFHGF